MKSSIPVEIINYSPVEEDSRGRKIGGKALRVDFIKEGEVSLYNIIFNIDDHITLLQDLKKKWGL